MKGIIRNDTKTMLENKMKITAIINDITLGGAQAVVLNIASLIDKERFDFSVCYINDYIAEVRPDFHSEFEAAGVTVTNLGKGGKRRLAISFFRLLRHLRQERPDILHCCLPDAVILGVFVGRLAGVKKIVIHEMNTHRFYSKKLEFFFRIARRFANLTITYSETLETELFGDFKILQQPIVSLQRNSYTIYNGIDLAKVDETKQKVSFEEKRKELGVDPGAILIFSAARLIEWKGFEYLVRAAPEVMAACPNSVILIAGGGAQEPFLRKLIDEFDLSRTVKLLGPRTDVYEILAVSDIYPQAYAYPEGFSSISISMSGMEAMAFNLPIVASRYPALYDHIKDKENACIVEPRDIEGLAKALIFLVNNKTERERIGKNARQFVEEYFSSRKTILIYESIYRALLSV